MAFDTENTMLKIWIRRIEDLQRKIDHNILFMSMYVRTDRRCRVFENIDHQNVVFCSIELPFEYFEWLPLLPVRKLNKTDWRISPQTFPASSSTCWSFFANPVVNRICKIPPNNISGRKPSTINVNCQEYTNPMMIPIPIAKKYSVIKPKRIPLAPCTADASVAKRVHSAPVLCLASSKYAISWRRIARKAFERSRLVTPSPDRANT